MSAAHLVSFGFAEPPHVPQQELAQLQSRALGLEGGARGMFERVVAASGIDSRGVAADVRTILDQSTAARMRLFAQHAPPVATAAARTALARAGVSPGRVTDLVVVTCTGFVAPGLHSDLVESLGLSPSVRPLQIGFMGCFGGIAALRAARNAAAADAEAVVLVVAVELCSLHFRRSGAPDALVSFALFADGASAAVVAGEDAGLAPLALLEDPRTELLGGRRLMGWTVEDDGFAMTLGKAVPDEIARHVAEAADGVGRSVAVHPGGLAIIDAVERGLGRSGGRDFTDAREVLRTTGNTSSGAVLRVAERVLSRNQRPIGCETALQPAGASGSQPLPAAGCRVDLMAFGPGLVADRIAAVGME